MRLIEEVVGETTWEKGTCLGLVSMKEVHMEDWSSSNLAAFSNWLGLPTIGFIHILTVAHESWYLNLIH